MRRPLFEAQSWTQVGLNGLVLKRRTG